MLCQYTALSFSRVGPKECVCVCVFLHQSTTRGVQEVHSEGLQVFKRKMRGVKIFSDCGDVPEKSMSSVFSSQLCHLSNECFLFIVKLPGFKQHMHTSSSLFELQYDKHL